MPSLNPYSPRILEWFPGGGPYTWTVPARVTEIWCGVLGGNGGGGYAFIAF